MLEALEVVRLDAVTQHPANARRHADALLRYSLAVNGQYRPVVVQRSTGYVLAGNGIHAAARELGWEELAAVFVDVDDDRAKRILAIDNRSSDLGSYDEAALVALLQELPDLDGTGYDMDAFEDLLSLVGEVHILPPSEHGAHYGETAEEQEARRQRLAANVPHQQQGIRDIVILVSLADYERFAVLAPALREAEGDEPTTGKVVMRAMEAYATSRGLDL